MGFSGRREKKMRSRQDHLPDADTPQLYQCTATNLAQAGVSTVTGEMTSVGSSGEMAPARPPGGHGLLPRNISATLLGEGEPDEPPILEELGINFQHIYDKTLSVLWPRRSKLDQA